MVSEGKKTGLCMGCGAFLVVLGAMSLIFWPLLYYNQLKQMMVLTNESMSFEMWRETPITMHLECFIFNITNVDDILANRADKIQVEQLGPYVYRETHTKVNLTWNSNSTITFYNQRYWYFEPELSNGSLSDVIVSVNPILVTIANYMRHRSAALNLLVDAFLRLYHRDMFLRANVSDWLFDGIDDPILDAANRWPDLVHIPYDKFGWFYDRNGSTEFDGAFVMNTGAEDFMQLGNIEMWQHSNRTFYSDECGVVRGSTGDLWAPELGQQEVEIFASDVCTYLTLARSDEYSVHGISGVMFAGNDSLFDNGHNYPHMECYCPPAPEQCVPSGALDVSRCRLGAPAYVSLPHFYQADPVYLRDVDGLDPKPDHQFRLALELLTGIPLFVAAQLQVNLLVAHVSGISINNQLPSNWSMVPMFWFRQELEMNAEYAALARRALTIRYAVPYALYAITVLGLAFTVWGITLLIRKLLRSPDTEPILEDEPGTSE